MRGAILAGGQASRFDGKPKGLERVGGDRILDRLVASMRIATGELPLLVANAEDAGSWRDDLRVVQDPRPDCGSLGGIYAAVSAGDGPVLVVAWDMPFVNADLLTALVKGSKSFDVYLPESGGRRGFEPLCAVYGAACADPIAKQLDNEDYRAIGFHAAVRVGTLPRDRVAEFGDPAELFFNVNTADDLHEAEETWRQHA